MEETVTKLIRKHGSLNVKELRKHVFVALNVKTSEEKKATKKKFKTVVLAMDNNKKVRLDADGTVQLCKRKREENTDSGEKKQKKKKKEKKKEDKTTSATKREPSTERKKAQDTNDAETSSSPSTKQTKTKNTNHGGVTRLFVGNLSFKVNEDSLSKHLFDAVTHIKWITDVETGKFYGSAFVEMKSPDTAADAVALTGQEFMGRSLKVNFAAARPGDVWPPEERVTTGGPKASTTKKGGGMTSEKPPDCVKLFMGNLSYDITDEALTKFLVNGADAEPKAIRWIHHAESGDFKGVGFCEFWSTEACEKAAKLNGKNLLGRPIRMDWTD